jgi:GDP-mannose transporter
MYYILNKLGIIVSTSLVLMIYTGSKALQYLSIHAFTVFKNVTIIVIAYAEQICFAGCKVTNIVKIINF